MAVEIKSQREIEIMREAGAILARTHEEMKKAIRPGISTLEINRICEKFIRSQGAIPSSLNYQGYPASVCISVNDEVVHGIPTEEKVLKEGDIVSLDCTVSYKGYNSDSCRSYAVGKISEDAQKLLDVTKESFFEGLKQAKAGNHICDISNAVYKYVTERGYSAVRDLVGHGIGADMHEDPEVPNFPTGRRGCKLRPGMTICIEPMINAGGWEVEWLDDDWTVVTADGSLAAHYENTVLITEGEPEILSRAEGIEL